MLTLTTLALTVSNALAPAPTLEDIAFMAGAWEAHLEGERIREVWDQPHGDVMAGHMTIIEGGSIKLYELLSIESKDDTVTMRIRHFNRNLVPWESEADAPTTHELIDGGPASIRGDTRHRAIFEDADNDFPHRIVYERNGDTMTASLLAAAGVEMEPIVIEFTAGG